MNVDPREIESVLLRHAGISEAGVVVVPDGGGGKTVKAVVVPAPGARLCEAEVLAFAASLLADQQKPKSVEFVERLPGELRRRGGTTPPGDGSS